jgi:hypothetical protein
MGNEVMTKSEKKLMDSLGQELQSVFGEKSERSFHDLVSALRSIENSYLNRLRGNQFLSLETRRRVAELILYSATEKGVPFEKCQQAFDDLRLLGFTSLEAKGIVLRIYSKYCSKIGRKNEGIALLAALEAELETEFNRKDLTKPARRFYSIELQSTRALLNELRAASTN